MGDRVAAFTHFGGYAEYAVINITTINNKDFNGVSAIVNGSWMSETFAHEGFSVAAGVYLRYTNAGMSLQTLLFR